MAFINWQNTWGIIVRNNIFKFPKSKLYCLKRISCLTSSGVTEIKDFLERDEIDVIGRVDGAGLAINLYKFNKHYGEIPEALFCYCV